MKHILLVFILAILGQGVLKSQDTLYMSNGEKIPSKIIEINPSEVKYKKSNNIDGPTYSSENADIKFIKYRNGSVDTIKSIVKVPETITIQTPTEVSQPPLIEKKPAIYVSGFYYRYNGKKMKEDEVHLFIQKKQDREIDEYVRKSKKAKLFEYVGLVAVPALIYGVVSARSTYNYNQSFFNNYYGTNNPSTPRSYGPTITAGIIGVLSLTTTIVSKPIRRRNTEAAIRIYNEKY